MTSLAVSAALTHASDVYKCTVGDKIVYQQNPCDPGGEEDLIQTFSAQPSSAVINGAPATTSGTPFSIHANSYLRAGDIDANKNCADRYPRDYSMREHCLSEENKDKRRLEGVKRRTSKGILDYCYHDNDTLER